MILKILIKDLRLFGYHGVRAQEKKDGQYFIFNICIDLKDEDLKESDDLQDTLSYSYAVDEVKKINSAQRFDLLETLSRKVADKIMSMSDLVERVGVRIEKKESPIDEDLGSVGVEYGTSNEMAASKKNSVRAFLSLGANMGDRKKNIEKALSLLESDPCIDIIKTSSYYETEPMYSEDQENFYNIAAEVKVCSQMDPFRLLGIIKSIEYSMGRNSGGKRYGPRSIDIDILYYGDEKIKSDILELPHPRIKERKFVLVPLSEIAPSIKIETKDIKTFLKKSIAQQSGKNLMKLP